MKFTPDEIWIDIKGYEGKYFISDKGRVLSTPSDGKPDKILKQEVTKRGNHTTYRRVTLSKEGKVQRFQVHRLVAEHFIPNPSNKPMVNHIDNDGSNNNTDNLEWCTAKENMQHSARQGRQSLPNVSGGITAGNIRKGKKLAEAEAMIGMVFGNLTITGLTLSKGRNPRNKFLCQCSCGNKSLVKRLKYELESDRKPNHCAECAQQLRRSKFE